MKHTTPRTTSQRHLVEVTFSKLGSLVFLSHREVANAFLRALRRAEWPVALSEGFTSRPRVAFLDALPVGVESTVLGALVELSQDRRPDDLANSLTAQLANGMLPAVVQRRPFAIRKQLLRIIWETWECEVALGDLAPTELSAALQAAETGGLVPAGLIRLAEVSPPTEDHAPARVWLSVFKQTPGLRPLLVLRRILDAHNWSAAIARCRQIEFGREVD